MKKILWIVLCLFVLGFGLACKKGAYVAEGVVVGKYIHPKTFVVDSYHATHLRCGDQYWEIRSDPIYFETSPGDVVWITTVPMSPLAWENNCNYKCLWPEDIAAFKIIKKTE